MAGKIGRMDYYDSTVETWDSYSERLEQYFICNDVKDEKKVPVLLTLIGGNTYSLLRGLTAPNKPSEETFANLVKVLKDHLCPKPLLIAERFRFHKRDQKEGESVRDYVAALRKLSEHCVFGGNLNDSLRDRLVCGLKSEHIQKKLLSEDALTFETAVDIANAMEAAARDATELQAKHNSGNVNKINFQKKAYVKPPKARYKGKPCFRCNKTGHDPMNCYFKDKECYACHKKGHSKGACKNQKDKHNLHLLQGESDDSDDAYIGTIEVELNSVRKTDGVIKITPKVNGVSLDMELDTGAAVSVISEKTFNANFSNVKLESSDVMLKTYTGEKLKPVGMARVNVEYESQCKLLKLYVVHKGGVTLFGREWLKHINLAWPEIKSIVTGNAQNSLKSVLDKHSSVFNDEWGTLKGIKAKLNLKPEANPKFVKARPVPYSMKPKVEAEINKLVNDGILEKCNYSEWATPIVPVPKKDGSVRLCGDFKVTVNPVLEIEQYPLPRIEDIFAALSGGKHFSKIDLKHAYLQMEVDEVSQPLLTINTEKGLYRFKRLVYGVASAPALWQRAMDTILQGLPGVKCIIDDMIITGRTDEEHLRNLEAVLEKLDEHGLRANLDKCEFFKKKVTFCGHEIDEKGLHKTQKKIEAVVEAPQPTNVSELRSFLGMVNYYSRFLPNLSTALHPLYQLLEKNHKWKWTEECCKSFKHIKKLITSDEVLTHYDPNLPLCLATDASPIGLGAVLSHIMPDGTERPIAYASRSLSTAEKNYSQIDKESLAIVWGVKRFNTYVFGRHFKLITDHQPLISIFSPRKGISSTSTARLQRQALFLAGYNYEIVYKNTKKHSNADCLSRLPLHGNADQTKEEDSDIEVFHISQFEQLPVKCGRIQQETLRDPLLSQVYDCVMKGWSEGPRTHQMDTFFTRRTELTVHQGCLLWGNRVIIPMSLQSRLLEELHQGHIGVVKMKSLARSHMWWPGIDKDIESLAKGCTGCQEVKHSLPAAPIHPWEWPSRPWERIHIDFAGPFLNSMFLVIVDAYSKWPEVIMMKSTTATNTVEVLRTVFARNGIPCQIVSDNGPQFVSEEFKNFAAVNGIRHTTSAPYHPSTNGLAERLVQSFKQALKASKKNNGSVQKKLSNFLLAYRNAPHSTTFETPARLFMGRDLPSRLDLIKPNIRRRVEQKQQEMQERRKTRVRTFEQGDPVSVRDYRKGHNSWTTGTVVEQTGPVSYKVEVTPGFTWRRHTDQLSSTERRNSKDTTQNSQPSSLTLDASPSNAEASQSVTNNNSSVPSVSETCEPRYPKRTRKMPQHFKDYVRH